MKIGILIPARIESQRLPRKVLRQFMGKPMIEHVWRRAQLINPKIETVIATDSIELEEVCTSFGAKVINTSVHHVNGLSRAGEAARHLDWDIFIVLQADEILVLPENIEKLIESILEKPSFKFFNLITDISKIEDVDNENIVKCLIRTDNTIINFSRKNMSIGDSKELLDFTKKTCGLFAISKEALIRLNKSPITRISACESIEQIKVLELGLEILGILVNENYPSVDTEVNVQAVNEIFRSDSRQRIILDLTGISP
jgi:3-deoxy-manno-octulosonate cytidylyltransferase (CMP-KDO synthetase)